MEYSCSHVRYRWSTAAVMLDRDGAGAQVQACCGVQLQACWSGMEYSCVHAGGGGGGVGKKGGNGEEGGLKVG